MMELVVTVREIKGECPVYSEGDGFRLEDGYKLVSDRPLCMHALASLMPYYNALRVSKPSQWDLNREGDDERAYIQCMDPEAYTGGGTVIFEIKRIDD